MGKLPLESILTLEQKIQLIILDLLAIIILYETLLSNIIYNNDFKWLWVTPIVLTPIIFLFSKKGFFHKNGSIYKGIYIGKILILKSEIKLNDFEAITILKFKKRKNYSSILVASHGRVSSTFNTFDIYLLCNRHTRKSKLISLSSLDVCNEAINFIQTYSNLKFEIYSPDFS
ncbi:hypothetical protein [Flagellimonas zhangzhouensis]|uniref:Uncharacterized protein n=1 Tax=Flagellimonas zhangzhouensis TaxID=1073328 RepID=A0A1H2RU81_9FLAO|nr:hypothetical protein [Allomuricauda zhangzhouensis]SDQ67157.1 hypothetical protein SAMN05216294_2129 [Allomuricauda zhangzhouensis]SDW22169.1 hypothetical protein SAMN04487892_0777 [Allomuricauda zhangzhouensis]